MSRPNDLTARSAALRLRLGEMTDELAAANARLSASAARFEAILTKVEELQADTARALELQADMARALEVLR